MRKFAKVQWQSMEEQFLVEYKDGSQTYWSYHLAVKYHINGAEWVHFRAAMEQPYDWFGSK